MRSFSFGLCTCTCFYLAQIRYGEAERLAVTRAGIHVVANEQDELQQLGEALARPELLTGRGHRHHVRLDVVQLLLKLQLEQDGLKPFHQFSDAGHLEGEKKMEEEVGGGLSPFPGTFLALQLDCCDGREGICSIMCIFHS